MAVLFELKPDEQPQLKLAERDAEEDLLEAIDKMIARGINSGEVKKLQDAGIYTCNGLMMHTKKRKAVIRITTGSQALDELLGGGIETLVITEALGEFRSWKTQIAHTFCVSTQLPTSMRGGNGKVAYIDTEGTFRPDRIVPIAKRFGMDPGAVLDNVKRISIIYARAYTYEHQYKLLLGLAAKMSEEPFGLLIADSVIALFRVDFSGRGELAEHQQKLAQMLSRLLKIAEGFNPACQNSEPASLAHDASVRLIMFRKGKGEQRICKNYVFTMSTPKITCIICLILLLFIEGVSADVAPVPEEVVPEDMLAAAVHGFVRRHGILRTILYALGMWFVSIFLRIIDDYFTGWLRYSIIWAFNFLRPKLWAVCRSVWGGLWSRLAAVGRRVREVFVSAYTPVPNVANGANPINPEVIEKLLQGRADYAYFM